jgi:hypothetical protein
MWFDEPEFFGPDVAAEGNIPEIMREAFRAQP